ncbi:MAG TPA: carboxypeptidase-like regulatory domain-containing protein [Ignavibacteria bacterium]|nr:carboxypeptidase-like regulatory domain-containing protein [Ignavibacteria bacterium]
MRNILLIFILLISNIQSIAQTTDSVSAPADITLITGFVKGEKDKLLSGVNIVIKGTIDGATSDDKGYFEFETEETGQHSLLFTLSEYSNKNVLIEIIPGKNINLEVKLSKEEVKTEEILVTASSFTSGSNTAVTLTPLEIVRIPGADADIYRAITTFPGSNQVNEGSRITVRGGNPNEVLTIIDQASLYNPFLFDETFNVSSYSTVNPWGLKGINFTSGGFSAKYGNVLSAVLDLKSYDMPQSTGMFAWLGLANASLDGVYVSKNRNFGATFSLGKLFLEPYFAINGKYSDYSPIPQSNQLGGTLSYKIGSTGNLKFYANYNDDKVGIFNAGPTFEGFFNTNSKNVFTNLKLMVAPSSSTLLNAGVSFSSYDRYTNYGILNTSTKEIYSKGRVDFTKNVTSKIDINTGVEYEYNGYEFGGTVPQFSYNLNLNAPAYLVNTDENSGRIGAYIESQIKLSNKVFVIPGIRSDYQTLSENISFDPRISFGYQPAHNNSIRGAFGVYHQNPKIDYFLRTPENDLKPEDALHYILGYEYNNDNKIIFRVEGFYKDYGNLVLFNLRDLYYRSEGEGYAKGVDVFIKTKIANKFTGWISYSYLDSKRKQYEAQNLVPSKFDITNTMSLVGSYNLSDQIVFGATLKMSTGEPYTPVIGSYYDNNQGVYVPVYGETNSDRFPNYSRVDINAQYIFSLLGKFTVAVLAFNNIFNQNNIYDYTYNYDYTEKREIITNNRRTVYLGLGMQF